MRNKSLATPCSLAIVLLLLGLPLFASDHVDSPNNAEDRAADLGDGYMFLDPNDNSRVVAIMTFSGFIVPGEAVNYGVFSDTVRYTFDFENTGDAVPDRSVLVTFSTKTAPTATQTATVQLWDGTSFTAPTSPISNTAVTAPDPVVTTDEASGISFFAGMTDDPFFFDIPAFGRFLASVRAGSPDASVFNRGRDSFAGYNTLAIALSIPVESLLGTNGDIIGVSMTSQRRFLQFITAGGEVVGTGRWVNTDRQGLPAINTALIPFSRKKEYNNSNPSSDAAGVFANDIVATLQSLGTDSTNIGILAGLAVATGDILRLDTSVANTGANAEAAFPNGRRLSDDVIDTILFFVANQNTLGDSVDSNEVAFRSSFPFLAPSHQPLAEGCDPTEN